MDVFANRVLVPLRTAVPAPSQSVYNFSRRILTIGIVMFAAELWLVAFFSFLQRIPDGDCCQTQVVASRKVSQNKARIDQGLANGGGND